MPKMVCIECETELKIKKNGVNVVEMFSKPPQPYKIWRADLWQCPKCQSEIVAGFADHPIAEHYESKFNAILEQVKQSGQRVIYDYEK